MASELPLFKQYEQNGQGHVFKYWDELNEEQRAELLNVLGAVDPAELNATFKATMQTYREIKSASSSSHTVEPLPQEARKTMSNPDDVAKWRKVGLQLIADGKVSACVLAGGQGTRLGVSIPKGMLDINLPSHRTLFEIMAKKLLRLRVLASEGRAQQAPPIPFVVMTSEPTHEHITTYFAANDYLGLGKENVIFFKQGFLPAFTPEGLILLEDKGKVAIAPDGNGGIYPALVKSGTLDALEKRGVKYIQAFSVDNILVQVADPVFFGFCESEGCDCAAKSIAKANPEERAGVFAVMDGRQGIVEYSEIGDERAAQRDADGTLVYNDANPAIHCYTIAFLRELFSQHKAALQGNFHVAEKDISTVFGKIPGVKLEAFIFDVFYLAKKFHVLRADRATEFSGIKNADGPGKVDTPSTARQSVYALHRSWLQAAGVTIQDSGAAEEPVEINPVLSYAGEGLESYRGKTLTTPVLLEPTA